MKDLTGKKVKIIMYNGKRIRIGEVLSLEKGIIELKLKDNSIRFINIKSTDEVILI